MKRFRRFLTGIMVALGVLSVGSIASAEEFMDLTPLFGNVNVAVPGVEVIMPLIQENDANKDKYSESVTFYFRVFRNNTTTLLYNTTPKVAPYPARTCTVPMSFDSWVEPTFVRSGKWMVMGSNLQMWCSSSTGRKENSNTFVYVADVSKAAGVVWTMVVNTWVYGLWNTPSREALLGGRWRAGSFLACAYMITPVFLVAQCRKPLQEAGLRAFSAVPGSRSEVN